MISKPRITGNPNGRPKTDISKDLLIAMYEKYQDWYTVAAQLGVSHMTVYRRLKEYGVSRAYNCNS